jgi:hypothetical protein
MQSVCVCIWQKTPGVRVKHPLASPVPIASLNTMQTTESIKRVTQATADACTTAARASRTAADQAVNYTRRNPMKVLLGAVGAGVLIAWALHRRNASWQDRTFNLPIKKMRNWVSSTAERAGESLHDYSDRAAELADDAMTAVRKSARGLRFWS